MKWVVVFGLVFASGLDAAQAPVAGIGDGDLLAYLGNMQIEGRLDADVTGDGRLDVVYVASNVHERVLGVIAGGEYTVQIGRRVIAEGSLDLSPQAPVTLGFEGGVLTVGDLTGADTVTSSVYQYRYVRLQNRMRLSELICEQYSPTFTHGSIRLSWNLDSGDHVVERGKVVTLDTGEDVYVYESEERTSRKAGTVFMDKAPRPTDLLVSRRGRQERFATDAVK